MFRGEFELILPPEISVETLSESEFSKVKLKLLNSKFWVFETIFWNKKLYVPGLPPTLKDNLIKLKSPTPIISLEKE